VYLKNLSLKNKTALVTGAGKGIGKACAIALAEAGADLIILSRTESDLIKVKRKILKLNQKCKIIVCDLLNFNELEKNLREIKKLDILVNNAGTNRPSHFTKIKKKDMDYMVDLNIKAAFNVAQISSQIMLKAKDRKKKGGSIINMSSQLGKVGAPIRTTYNMTKFAIEGLTRGMSIDLASNNIRVNSVCPTFVETPMVKRFFLNKKFKKETLKNIPLNRFATESDIASAVVYLASNASSIMTGTSMILDGGWTAK